MNRFLLDTHILIAYLRGHDLYRQIEQDHQLAGPDAVILITVNTKAELLSLARQNHWEDKQIRQLDDQLSKLHIIDINEADQKMLDAYAAIDAFSRGSSGQTPHAADARKMGKNDLWIAAAAHVTQSALITTNSDFDPLHGQFFQVLRYPREA